VVTTKANLNKSVLSIKYHTIPTNLLTYMAESLIRREEEFVIAVTKFLALVTMQ
jgi:hypothetical protein